MAEQTLMPGDITPYAQPEHQPFTFGKSPHRALLIHGFPGTPAETRPLGRALAETGIQTRGPLLPGFGPDIVNIEERGSEDWLGHITAEWNHLSEDAQSRTLIGYSLGGALALNLAQQLQPDCIVLIAPFWKLPGLLPKLVPFAKYFINEYKPFADADFDDPETRASFERIMPSIDMDDPQVRERIREELTLPMDTIDQVLKVGARAGHSARWVSVPCLVVQGSGDEVVLPRFTRKLANRIPDDLCTYQAVASGHDIIQEYAPKHQKVARIVIDFLESVILHREVAV